MRRLLLVSAGRATEGDDALIDVWRADPGSWLWLDLMDEPAARETDLLVTTFGLDPLDVEEAQRPRHPPQFHAQGGGFYLLLKPLVAESHDMEFATQQVALFRQDRLLVTRRASASPFYDARWQGLLSGAESFAGPTALAAAIAGRLVERYGEILLGLEQRLDEIEDEIFDAVGDVLMQELLGYNTALRKMRRILAYHVQIYDMLARHMGEAEPEHEPVFTDLVERIERFSSLANLYQDVINDLIDGYISLNGHKLNQIMKVLTIVTVIFLPLALLVGIYGMNFEYMPELKSRYGYFVLIGVMASLAFGLLWLFRRLRWL